MVSIWDIKKKEKERVEDIPRGMVCYELAFQARKTYIERLSFCAGGNSGVR